MPSHSVEQAKTMSAIAHGWKPKGSAAGIPLKVAKEFHAADAGHKYGKGRADGGRTITAQDMADAAARRLATQKYRLPQPNEPEAPVFKASGGGMGNFNPERAAAIGLSRQGLIHSSIPGRTDKLNLNVPTGSYIIPADIPGAIGQGNSLAGGAVLDKMFNSGPYGMNLGRSKAGSRLSPRHSSLSFQSHFARGGDAPVAPIVAAGGEYIVHPQSVIALGEGNIKRGHDILDQFVKHVREKHIHTLKKLKPPKGSK